MIKTLLSTACALSLLCMASLAQAAPSAPAAHSTSDLELLQAKLDAYAAKYLEGCNFSIRPCKTDPVITTRPDGKVTATYMEIDPVSLTTEIFPTNSKDFPYMAKLVYLEHTYQAVANTREEALVGAFQRIKSRRLTELPRYVRGEWLN